MKEGQFVSMIVAGDEHTSVPMKPGCGVNADGGGSIHERRGGAMMRGAILGGQKRAF